MKKMFFIIATVMMVAFLATSCGPKTPEPILLGNGDLTAYATLQDKASETFLWGVRETKSGMAKIKCVFTAPPKALEEFFIGETSDKKIVFDNTGKILISGTYCFIDNLVGGEKFIVSRTEGEGEKVYITANGKTVGPKEKLFIRSDIYRMANSMRLRLRHYARGFFSIVQNEPFPFPFNRLFFVLDNPDGDVNYLRDFERRRKSGAKGTD